MYEIIPMIDQLKQKWGIESTHRVVLIFVIFGVTGSLIMILKEPIFQVLQVPSNTTLWLQIPLAVLIYQVLLLAVGSVFGEFRFFWEKEKRLVRLFGRPFRREVTPPPQPEAKP